MMGGWFVGCVYENIIEMAALFFVIDLIFVNGFGIVYVGALGVNF